MPNKEGYAGVIVLSDPSGVLESSVRRVLVRERDHEQQDGLDHLALSCTHIDADRLTIARQAQVAQAFWNNFQGFSVCCGVIREILTFSVSVNLTAMMDVEVISGHAGHRDSGHYVGSAVARRRYEDGHPGRHSTMNAMPLAQNELQLVHAPQSTTCPHS